MLAKFREFNEDSLQFECPLCGGDNVHQNEVVVMERVGSEDTDVLRTTCKGSQVKTEYTEPQYGRRNSLVIRFACESCPGTFALVVMQHKGITFLVLDEINPNCVKVDFSLGHKRDVGLQEWTEYARRASPTPETSYQTQTREIEK